MELSWLDKKISELCYPDSTPLLAGKIDSMKKTVDMTVLSVRRIATELRPGILDNLEEEACNAKSLGLLGMRERVDLLGGVRVPIRNGLA
jgi:signal transduction histidine kinase